MCCISLRQCVKVTMTFSTGIHFAKNVLIRRIFNDNIQICKRWYMPRRALMYVPGDDTRKLNKAFKIDVDCIVMDFEDGVAANRKEIARSTIRKLLDNGKPVKPRNYDWAIRVNSIPSGLCEEDLEIVLTADSLPDSILLPKIDTVDDVRYFADMVNRYIKKDKSINLIMYIETAMAMISLPDLCRSALDLSKNSKFTLSTLIFGSDDFCANIGITRTNESTEISYARQKLVLVAKAYGLQAIDMVYIMYKDLDGLKRQSDEGARMGYTGKQVIHPAQVPIVQDAFMPSQNSVDWATGVIEAFDEHQKSGKGAFNYDGTMIDMPTMKQAQNIINIVKSV